MPNTPALVGAGAAAIAGGSAASDDDLAWAESILAAVGIVVRVDESLLDAVTGVSGSGPAYVFRFAEALIEAGVRAGLPREISVALTEQTLTGSARLLASSEDPPEALRAAVTSPGGTTAAALRVLDDAGWFDAMVATVSGRDRSLTRARGGLIHRRRSVTELCHKTGPFPVRRLWFTVRFDAEKGLSMAQSVARTRFLTVAEVAQSLRVSTMTVYRLVKAGQLGATRVGKSYRISESDLDHYLASRYTQAG